VNLTFRGVALPAPEARSPTLAYRFEHGLLEGPVIDDEDAVRELLDGVGGSGRGAFVFDPKAGSNIQ
jgi:hypothetical protein